MRYPILAALAALVLSVGVAAVVRADGQVAAVFTPDEVRIITSWYQDHGDESREAKAGRGKPGGLPPGIAKNLAQGKALPPGIAKQYLPEGLARILPPPPRGFERVIVDGKVLLVEVATQVIHDVLVDLVLK